MEEKVGAYRIEEDGNIVPDERDKAMAARFGLKEKVKQLRREEKENAFRK